MGEDDTNFTRFDRREGRKIYNSGEIYAGELKVVESRGVFISIPRERFEELRAARLARQQDVSKA